MVVNPGLIVIDDIITYKHVSAIYDIFRMVLVCHIDNPLVDGYLSLKNVGHNTEVFLLSLKYLHYVSQLL